MRGVIQVRCQRPWRRPAQAGDHAFEIAVEGHRVAALAHQPPQIVGDVEVLEEQHRALRRRPPFQRRDMRQRIKPAPVGGEQGRQREDRARCRQGRAGCRARARDRAGHSRAPATRRSRAGPGPAGRRCASASAPRPARASSVRPYRRGSRGTARRGGRRAPVARKASYDRRGRPRPGPKRVEMAKILALISHAGANGGLSE